MTETNQEAAPSEDTAAEAKTTFWQENLRLLASLLGVWFVVSFGFGIILRDTLDSFSILGVPAGFWFAQQGSIYIFIILIFYYSRAIHKIEQRHGVDDDDTKGEPS